MRRGSVPGSLDGLHQFRIASDGIGSHADCKPLDVEADLFQESGLPNAPPRQDAADLRLASAYCLRNMRLGYAALSTDLRCSESSRCSGNVVHA